MKNPTKKIGNYIKTSFLEKFNSLALSLNAVNLAGGIPDWKCPRFFLDTLEKYVTDASTNHQYTRSSGNIKLVKSIAETYKETFHRNIDPFNEIIISTGALNVLYWYGMLSLC